MSKKLTPLIVKLGGSVITYKSRSPPMVNHEVIDRIAHELKTYHNPLVLILGGGAHGHQAAHEFGFGNPSSGMNRRIAGIPLIRHNMTLLSQEMETALARAGIPTVVIPPFCTTVLRNGLIDQYYTESITRSLKSGFVVITHGDVCFDIEQGALILSGDTLVSWLSKELGVTKVLVGTDVDGIFDSDPKSVPTAQLISQIDSSNVDQVILQSGPSTAVDVTGGMTKKISELASLMNRGVEIIIFNLLVPGRLEQLLHGTQTICTRFLPSWLN
ncbi:MAG: isopentenyl phosphate kinase family protein [Candidatus Thorarchaeota archaeon]|nr:isopentenyl phosphate kinase family protein [Candidatus Thorarchaeota archaeon]